MKLLHHKYLLTSSVGDLSASTTCRRQLLGCCDQLAEGVSRCWSWIPFLEENAVFYKKNGTNEPIPVNQRFCIHVFHLVFIYNMYISEILENSIVYFFVSDRKHNNIKFYN